MKKTLRFVLFGLLALVLTAVVAIVLIAKIALAPAQGEWTTRWQWGPVGVDVGVPTAIRLATSSWLAPHLDGRSVDTRHGKLQFGWREAGQTLELRCAPCSANVPAIGPQPLRATQLVATVQRNGNALAGTLDVMPAAAPAGQAAAPIRGRWTGRLTPATLPLQFDFEQAPIARWYSALAPALPELAQARIGGTLALRAQVTLPAGTLALQPQIAQFTVEGVGTEALLGARSQCGPSARLVNESWLTRAVLAAEDQRFFTHPGYDIAEWMAAIDGNQKRGAVDRGGSTLTQQLAKLLVTGDERSVERKLRELLYAVAMEQSLGKARILQLYLDNAPWGEGVCGAEAAAQRYFKRSAARLEPAQAVWLAAMLNNPQHALDQWRRDGSLDTARTKWVAESVRGIGRVQRESLLKNVAAAKFGAP